MASTIASLLQPLIDRELDALAEKYRREHPPLFACVKRPWPAPSLFDWRTAVIQFDHVSGRWFSWTPPEDAYHFEHPAELMARRLAEAYRPEGVP